MGGAILRGALHQGLLQKENVTVTVRSKVSAQQWQDEWGVTAQTTLPPLQAFTCIILAVKPQVLPAVLPALGEVKEGTLIVSVAAGITLETLSEAVPQAAWYRAMPNTPVAVGAGFTALTAGRGSSPEQTESLTALFEAIGTVEVVSEADLDRLGALAGAGPGYAFVIIDALADAGVRIGLTRPMAIKAAAAALYGAGKMALETEKHPAVLRDQVTSPGGTTIVGIGAMEAGGLRSALQAGVVACYNRSNELGKKKK